MTDQATTPAKAITEPRRTTGAVAEAWALWDSIADGDPLPRSFMIDLACANGCNFYTARTQAQRWLTARRVA